MTYVLAYSITGVYDVTKRYVKDWQKVFKSRKEEDINSLQSMIVNKNFELREKLTEQQRQFLNERDILEECHLNKSSDKVKYTYKRK
jgi:Rad4 transglutaminase-like domain